MTKDDLVALGLTEEQAKKLAEKLEQSYVAKERLQEVEAELTAAKATIKERDGQLETLRKASGDAEELKAQIAALQQENHAKDEAHAAELSQLKLDHAIDAALLTAGAKNAKAVKALLDLSKVKLGEDGKLAGWEEQLSVVQKSDAYLFAEKGQRQQSFRGFQPGVSGSVSMDTSKMTYSELAAYMAANPEAKIQ